MNYKKKFIEKKLLKLTNKYNDYSLYSFTYDEECSTEEEKKTAKINLIKQNLCLLQIQYLKKLLK